MARNLIAYFGGKQTCKAYRVKIIADSSSNNFEEIYLAGDSPFVVTYDTSRTPFDPIRFSRASINVVADNKLFDIFSSDSHGTQVILEKEDNNEIMWVGYLTNNLLQMPQDSCGYETFTLEAQDCLYTLDKFDYKTIGSKKSIVSFKQILIEILNTCGLFNSMFVDGTMHRPNGSYIEMGALTISEQNFFSSDTDEPWNLREVLEEMCKYCGYTAMQYKDRLCLFDMQSHVDSEVLSDEIGLQTNGFRYLKSDNWSYTFGSFFDMGVITTLRQDIIKGSQADVSLETLFNKIEVKDSFYEIDHFIPDIYEDNLLENRSGEFWKSNYIGYTGKFTYLNKKGKAEKEEKNENEHVYYQRRFDHKNYESIYRHPITLQEVNLTGGIRVTNLDYSQQNNLVNHTGTYDVTATLTNMTSTSKSVVVKATLEYTWWNGSSNQYQSDIDRQTINLGSGSSVNISLHCDSYWDGRYEQKVIYKSDYTVDGVNYDMTDIDGSDKYIGGTVVDLATFEKPMDTNKYNYETESNINFDRYLMIRQKDKPIRQHPYGGWIFMDDLTPLKDNQIESVYPAVFKLKDGYTNPMIIDDNAYIALDATGIWERYDVPYINPDWTHQNTNLGGLGLFNKTSSITTITPALIFKLQIGDKYWSTQSGWTTTDCCFVVKMGTDKTDKDDVDFTEWWNEDHPVLNNIEWTDWAGCHGYKIPLDPSFDFTQDIKFQVHLPSKMQVVTTGYDHSGMNNYCWIKDLKIDFTTKDSEVYDLSDIIYENVINSGSVNTLSSVNLKITTYPGHGMHSYSNVALDGQLLTGFRKEGLYNPNYEPVDEEDARNYGVNKPEENIIKAYANQYSTATIKQDITISDYISPFSRIKDPSLDGKYFGIIGATIDYANESQRVSLIETKKWHMD